MTVAVEELRELKSDQLVDARATTDDSVLPRAKGPYYPMGYVTKVLSTETGCGQVEPAQVLEVCGQLAFLGLPVAGVAASNAALASAR